MPYICANSWLVLEFYREKGKEGVSSIWLVSLHHTQCHFLGVLTVSFPDIPPIFRVPIGLISQPS